MHLRSRSIANRLTLSSSTSSSSTSSSLPSPSSLSTPSRLALSARRLKALLQFIIALSILASLLLYLAGSSPTGFSNSATSPAAHAVADVFVRYRPKAITSINATRVAEKEQAHREEEQRVEEKNRDEVDPDDLVLRKMGGAAPRLETSSSLSKPGDGAEEDEGETEVASVEADQDERDALDRALLLKPLPRAERLSKASPWTLAKTLKGQKLPPCEKIMLFTFLPWWGFASEYILYLRAASAAKRLGYTLVEDDRNWNYGRLTDYFLPRPLSCVPPTDWADPKKSYPFHQGSHWRNRPRLRYSRVILSNLDDWTREEYLSSATSKRELAALQKSDVEHAEREDRAILEEGGTLPHVFEEVFQDQADAFKGLWRLKADMKKQIAEIKKRTGLDMERWTSEDDEGEGHETRRGPVIALHVRLGDKASEYEHDSKEMGITNTFGNLTVYIDAAHDAYRRLIPSSFPSLSPPPVPGAVPPHRFSPYARPTLLLITAEPHVSSLIADIPLAGPFRVLETPPPDMKDGNEEGETRHRLEEQMKAEGEAERKQGGPKAYAAAGGGVAAAAANEDEGIKMVKLAKGGARAKQRRAVVDPPTKLSAGYNQAAFNALPLLERVVHTQAFVRDLTIIAREADAAVMSGASNVGRLAMLLAGKEAVVGPLDEAEKSLGGRIRSVDAHWYPTAYSTAVYTAIEDVEDMEHAAFVPKEQHDEEVKVAEEKRRQKKKEKQRLVKGM